MFDLDWLNVPYKEWHKYEGEHRAIEKRHGLFKLRPSLNIDGDVNLGHYFLMNESDISKALIKEWIFFYLDKYQAHCHFHGLNRFYPPACLAIFPLQKTSGFRMVYLSTCRNPTRGSTQCKRGYLSSE